MAATSGSAVPLPVPDLTVDADPRPEFFVALLDVLTGDEPVAPPSGSASTDEEDAA